VWFTSLDYKNAQPDPLREFAENLVAEINANNMEDITRFCNVYVDLDFQVLFLLVFFLDGFEFKISQGCRMPKLDLQVSFSHACHRQQHFVHFYFFIIL
jgi:hypothetical protein